MNRPIFAVLAAALAVLAFAAGFLLRGAGQPAPVTGVAPGAAAYQRLPEYRFEDQHGEVRALAAYPGKTVVVNFWATWCAPCREEIPLLIELQAAHPDRLQVIGVAIDESEAVKEYARDMGFNYPTGHGDQSALAMLRRFGNEAGGLPYTVIADGSGNIVDRHMGIVSRDTITRQLPGSGQDAGD